MKTANVLILCAILIAALAVPIVMQQQTIKQLRQDIEGLKQQAAQIAPLQEQLDRATQDAANAGSGAESQKHELVRLRAEVTKLREDAKALAKAQQQIQSLNTRLDNAVETSRTQAAALQDATQKSQTAQAVLDRNACINNLRLIDSAKQQWALEFHKQATDIPGWDDLRPYFGHGANGELPTCPDGGVYTIGAVSEKPTCNIQGHVLP